MGLQNRLREETVTRLPMREAVVVSPKATLREAVAKMRDRHLGCAVIAEEDGIPVAFFTERALIDALLQEVSLGDVTVSEFAEQGFPRVCEDDPIVNVWEAVVTGEKRFVLVTDDQGQILGLTGQRGLAEYVSEYYPQQIMVQRLGAKPVMQQREGA